MKSARITPLATYRPDRLKAARNVVLRAEKMSLIDETQRRAVLTLAWSVLREDRDLRQGVMPGLAGPLPCAEGRLIDFASAHPGRVGPAWRSGTPRHRITLAQVHPSDPKDAA